MEQRKHMKEEMSMFTKQKTVREQAKKVNCFISRNLFQKELVANQTQHAW
jgi:hypothetical protein